MRATQTGLENQPSLGVRPQCRPLQPNDHASRSKHGNLCQIAPLWDSNPESPALEADALTTR
eukprot:4060343-Amphidinium_carterae.1